MKWTGSLFNSHPPVTIFSRTATAVGGFSFNVSFTYLGWYVLQIKWNMHICFSSYDVHWRVLNRQSCTFNRDTEKIVMLIFLFSIKTNSPNWSPIELHYTCQINWVKGTLELYMNLVFWGQHQFTVTLNI